MIYDLKLVDYSASYSHNEDIPFANLKYPEYHPPEFITYVKQCRRLAKGNDSSI